MAQHKSCSAEGCEKPAKNGLLCWTHYCRKRRHGSLDDPRKPLSERFAANVVRAESGCWLWVGSLYRGGMGYGRMWVDGRSVLAHRLSYLLHTGDIAEGLNILHTCDNPKCVNPRHLYQGTCQDNTNDREARNRHPHDIRGSAVYGAKLTEGDIPGVFNDSRAYAEIAADYGVSKQTVCLVKNRKVWKHVRVG